MFAIGSVVAGITVAVKALGVAFSARRHAVRGFIFVRIWFALLLLEDLVLIPVYRSYGVSSLAYARAYYWMDFAVALIGFLVLIRLAEISFTQSKTYLPLMRGTAIAILAGIAIISITAVFGHMTALPSGHSQMLSLAQEMEQNVSVAGMLASILLWISINVLAVPGVRLRRVVAGMGIFYSASGGAWALIQLGFRIHMVVPFMTLLAVALLAYAVGAPESALEPAGTRSLGEVTA